MTDEKEIINPQAEGSNTASESSKKINIIKFEDRIVYTELSINKF